METRARKQLQIELVVVVQLVSGGDESNIESHNFYLNIPVALLCRVLDVALLGHVHTVKELTDILVADKGGLVDEGA